MREGLAGFDGVFAHADYDDSKVAPAVWISAVADHGNLAATLAAPARLDRAREALAIARELGDPHLIASTLQGCGGSAMYDPHLAEEFYSEAIDLLRELGDWAQISEIRLFQAFVRLLAGMPAEARAAAEDGRDFAAAGNDGWRSRGCRIWLGIALMIQGQLADAATEFASLVAEAEAIQDQYIGTLALVGQGQTLASQGYADRARNAATSALDAAAGLFGSIEDTIHVTFANAALAAGDAVAARQSCEVAMQCAVPLRQVFTRCLAPMAEAALACGDLAAARRWADDTVAVAPGWHRMVALTARALVAIAQGEPQQADRDLQEALAIAAATGGYLRLPDTLECLARLVADGGNHQSGARLFGAAAGVRERTGEARFAVFQADHDAVLAELRNTLGEEKFDSLWREGAQMSTEEAIAYARRGHGERKRAAAGWESLTPAELDVVRLVREGLGNRDIGTRLFISPRTVQTHLTHVYGKLGLSSRVQLVQEAARHT